MIPRLQINPENAYLDFFRDIIGEFLTEIVEKFPGLLTESAENGLEKVFWETLNRIAERILRDLSKNQKITARETVLRDISAKCARLAQEANNRLPLLFRDHLCCGNSALVEYYLSCGKKEQAGIILNRLKLRKEQTGAYMTMPPGFRNPPRLSLFYGIAGIGYEMLRYAFPDQILSLL